MKDLLLLFSTLGLLLSGYGIIKKVDDFIEGNQQRIAMEKRQNSCQIRIAAESPMLLGSVACALEYCADVNPYMEFFISTGSERCLYEKLENGSIDMALLAEEHVWSIRNDFRMIKIPCKPVEVMISTIRWPVENLEKGGQVCVLWNKTISSLDRDRVLFALENDFPR